MSTEITISGGEKIFSTYRSCRPETRTPPDLRQIIATHVLGHWSDEDTVDAHRLLHHAAGRVAVRLEELDLTAEDRAFAKAILDRPSVSRGNGGVAPGPIAVSGMDKDFLAGEIDLWHPIKALNFALLMAAPATPAAAIVATVRNEGIAILEWIAHHKSIGFEQIFLYTNDNNDGSLPLLETLANAGEIRLIINEVSPQVSPQVKVYEHSLHLLPDLRHYRWVAYLDADEFLICNAGPEHTLAELLGKLDAPEFENVSTIGLNWRWFSSGAVFSRSNGLVLERFDAALPNEHVKSIVKPRDVIKMPTAHAPILFSGRKAVNGALTQFDRPSVTTAPAYDFAQINHYWGKSFEEFVLKKVKGRVSKGLAGAQLDFSNFFDWDAPARAELDLPPASVIERTRKGYERLRAIDGIAEQLIEIERRHVEAVRDFDQKFNMKKIYAARGR